MTRRTNDTEETGFWSARLVLSLLLIAIALAFVLSNLHAVPVGFLGLTWTLPMWIWLVLLLAVGVGIGWMRPWRKRR